MADLGALRDAEALVALSGAVVGRTESEVATLVRAVQLGREGLARVEAVARASGDHAGILGSALREGRRRQESAVALVAAGAAVIVDLWPAALAGALLDAPALATAAQRPRQAGVPASQPLPAFAVAAAAELRREPLAAGAAEAAWDLLAAGVKTLADRHDEALALLDAAAREAERAAEARRREPGIAEQEERGREPA
jgi:hypothetical protein